MGVEENSKTVILKNESGSSAEIYLFGATVTSWKVNGEEKLFLSSKSSLDSSKPIRGGIPIVFPIFGAPPSSPPEYAALKQHGFARSNNWRLDKVLMDRPEGVSVRFVSPPPPEGFEHKYRLAFVVTLAAHQLSTDLHIINEDDKEFKFQALLHNYLAVPDAKKLSITGIDRGTRYKDKTQNFKDMIWPGEPLTIEKEVDSVFQKLDSQELKLDYGNGKGLTVRFRGFEDTTIWNPQEGGRGMADMEDGGWERYVCIEPGYVRDFKVLQPGEEFLGQQVMTVF